MASLKKSVAALSCAIILTHAALPPAAWAGTAGSIGNLFEDQGSNTYQLLPHNVKTTVVNDFNDTLSSGKYTVEGVGNAPTGTGCTGNVWAVDVTQRYFSSTSADAGSMAQEAQCISATGATERYVRVRSSSVWTAWSKFDFGTSGGGSANATGTVNNIAKFTPDGNSLGDSQIVDNGVSTATFNGINNAFGVIPGNGAATITSGIYRDASGWVPKSSTSDAGALSLSPANGALWYNSNNNTLASPWNVANGVTLWDRTGIWNAGVQSSSADNNWFSGTGNFGLGTNAPATKLEIKGIAGANELRLTNSGNSRYSYFGHDGVGSYWRTSTNADVFQVRDATGVPWTTWLNGNVGIGTATPLTQLHVRGVGADTATYNSLRLDNAAVASNGTSNNLLFYWNTIEAAKVGAILESNTTWNTSLAFSTAAGTAAATEKLRITSAGNVGVGTTNPVAKIEVLGAAYGLPATTGTAQTGLVARLRDSRSAGDVVLDIGNAAANNAVWLQSTDMRALGTNYALLLNPNGGNVGVGTTNPGTLLDVAGQITGSGFIDKDNVAFKIDPSGATVLNNLTVSGTLTASISGGAGIATSLAGGSIGTLPYQSASGVTAMLAAGTAGYVLRANGGAAPSWVASSSVETDPKIGANTTNYLAKWNGTSLVSGTVVDNGTSVVVGNGATVNSLSAYPMNGATWLSAGAYFNGTGWSASTPTNNAAALNFVPATGVFWYDSNNISGGTWNVANAVQLWNTAGTWSNNVQTSTAGDNYFAGAGNFGIGTSGPSATLNIFKASGASVRLTNTLNTAENVLDFQNSSGRAARLAAKYTNPASTTETYLSFSTNVAGSANDTPAEIMRLVGDKVGIGTPSPATKLDVAGQVTANGFIDKDNAAFTVDPNGTTVLNNLTVSGTLTASISGGAGTANNLSGGAAGSIPYQSAAGITAMLAAGTAGYVLRANGAAAPSWVATSSVESDPKIGANTTNYLAKWNGTALVSGMVQDNGTTVNFGVGTSAPAFGIMPWGATNEILLSAGAYYNGSAWVHQSPSNENAILTIASAGGGRWYASNTGTPSWNVASNVQLWNSSGYWASNVQTSTAGNNYFAGAGNFGIGTAGPGYKLDVNGSLRAMNNSSVSTISMWNPAIAANSTNYYKGLDVNASSYSIPAGVTDSGYRIGIASHSYVDSPAFQGTLASQYGIWARNGSYTGAGGSIGNSYGVYIETLTSGTTSFGNLYGLYQSTAAAKNYFAGNVGIGIVPANNALEIAGATSNGVIGLTRSDLGGSNKSHALYGATGDWYLRSSLAGGKIVLQDTGGNVGIGTAAPAYNLDVSGDARVTGNLTVNGTLTANVTLLASSGNYVWNAATLAETLPHGVTNSFVAAAQGFPSYGTLINARSYSAGGGGAVQIYAPYGSAYGGTSLQYRTSDYSANPAAPPWTAFKTIVDSGNIGTFSVGNADTVDGYHALGLVTNAATDGGGFNRGDWQLASSTNGATDYTTATLELRESNFGGGGNTAPRLSFHWGGVVASQISVESTGRIVIRDNPGSGYEDLGGKNSYFSLMYDVDNPAYYANPAGTSVLNTINATALQLGTNGGMKENDVSSYGSIRLLNPKGNYYGVLFGTALASPNLMFDDSGNGGFYNQGGLGWATYINGATGNYGIGTTTTTYKLNVGGNMGATVYYDWDSPTYYVDPNGATVLNNLTVSGTLTATISGGAGTLAAEDNRVISPSELPISSMKFGFTSYTNNNAAPFADFLHMRSYVDSSGGSDNLFMLNKTGLGARVYQHAFGSVTAYSTYKDVALSDNSPTANALTKYTGVGNNVSVGNSQIIDNGVGNGIAMRVGGATPAFGILPWASQVYLSAGMYYNGGWVQQSDTSENEMMVLDPGSGVLWYASNDGLPSWNVTSGAVTLWGASGNWNSGVQSSTAGNNYFAGAGNFGIGTNAPGAKLTVAQAIGYNTDVIRAYNTTHSNSMGIGLDANSTYWGAALYVNSVKVFNAEANGGSLMGLSYVDLNAPANGLAVQGDVGIGTNTPNAALNVFGPNTGKTLVSIEPSAQQGATFAATNSIGWKRNADSWTPAAIGQRYSAVGSYGGVLSFFTHADDGSAASAPLERMTILANGNVGVGTTAPANRLTVQQTASAAQDVATSNDAGLGLQLQNSTAGIVGLRAEHSVGNPYDGDAVFYNQFYNGASYVWKERMRVRSDGNVGIGTSAPAYKLDVNGNMAAAAYYDSNSGAYYLDPAGTSNLKDIFVNSITVSGAGGGCIGNC